MEREFDLENWRERKYITGDGYMARIMADDFASENGCLVVGIRVGSTDLLRVYRADGQFASLPSPNDLHNYVEPPKLIERWAVLRRLTDCTVEVWGLHSAEDEAQKEAATIYPPEDFIGVVPFTIDPAKATVGEAVATLNARR